jgi:hypothetical protein
MWEITFQIPADAELGETRLRVGVNQGSNPLPCGPQLYGEFHDYTVNITPDITAPVIELLGLETIYLEVFDTYAEPGYTAWDDADGDLTDSVQVTSTLDNTTLGSYDSIIYYVEDRAGNSDN